MYVMLYNKVIISMDNISNQAIKEIMSIQDDFFWKSFEEVIDLFRCHWNQDNAFFSETVAWEFLILVNFLIKKWYNTNQISLFINEEYFVFNDDLYIIRNKQVQKIYLNKTLFLSLRWTNWNYPIFHILEKILEKKWWKMSKTNFLNYCIPFKGKFYALKNLYTNRKKFIWDIIIPYKIKPGSYGIFMNFIVKKLWNEIILKKDNTQTWAGVYACDLFSDEWKKKFCKIMTTHREFLKEVYIVPYYDFEQEYRFYFIKRKWKIKIYSVKVKNIITSRKEILKKDSFLYWDNVLLDWRYISNKEWRSPKWEYYEVYRKALDYLKHLEYETWSLEFAKTKDGRYIFLEVNSMSDPICFKWEDYNNIKSYYEDLIEGLI